MNAEHDATIGGALLRRGVTFACRPAAHSHFVGRLWRTLRAQHPELPSEPALGIATYELPSGVVKTAVSRDDCFFACEAVLLDRADSFEIFHVRLGEDVARAGWRRRGSHAGVEPPGWTAAAEDLPQTEVAVRADPSFLTLVSQLAGTGVTVSTVEMEETISLQAEVALLRETTRHQDEVIRQLRVAALHGVTLTEESPSATRDALRVRDVALWAAENTQRIVVMNRAIAEAKASTFEDADLLYSALELLANEYRLVKLNQMDRSVLKERCGQLGLSIGGSVEPSRAGSEGESYFVYWGGRRRFLDQHLGRGTSRDPRYCLRIYFTWSAEEQKALVGWLPTHLGNSRS